MLKVLSIDFDFFQNVNRETLNHYPDGVDLSTELSKAVWAGKYVSLCKESEMIKNVTVDMLRLSQLLDILENQDCDIPVMIAQSHKSIYDFIHEHMDEENSVSIVNIDLHHDMFNDNIELDCGNWISHIKNDYPKTTITWITREVSLECYGLTVKDKIPFALDFSEIADEQFDIVFICRSDAWLPPHLDTYFDDVVNFCSYKFNHAVAQNCVLDVRDISDIVEQEEQVMQQIMKQGVIMDGNSNSVAEQKIEPQS